MKILFLFILIAAAGISGVRAQGGDPLAKWIPNVGDRFVYNFVYNDVGYSYGSYSDKGTDTLIEDIIEWDSVATSGDTIWHVLASIDSFSSGKFLTGRNTYSFRTGSNTNSTHAFLVRINLQYNPNALPLDFSNSADSQTQFGTKQLRSYYTSNAGVVIGSSENGYDSAAAIYSPDVRWFLYRTEHSYFPTDPFGDWSNSFSASTLISADVHTPSGVKALPSNASATSVQLRGSLLQIESNVEGPLRLSLIEPVGRTVRDWQLGAKGNREITLNVADVPSGVYFLRLQGGGVDEVRKVAIVH